LAPLGATPAEAPPSRLAIGHAVQQLQAGTVLPGLPQAYREELAVVLLQYDEAVRTGQERGWRKHMNHWIMEQEMRTFLERK
jgi:hypothetical protein